MLSQTTLIISLLVFFFLLLSGSTLEPALIKSAAVFFCLIIGFKICGALINLISASAPQDQEPPPDRNSAEATT